LQLCKWLNKEHDMETSTALIPLVYDLTHILGSSFSPKMRFSEASFCGISIVGGRKVPLWARRSSG
jgi:hypothetical protein